MLFSTRKISSLLVFASFVLGGDDDWESPKPPGPWKYTKPHSHHDNTTTFTDSHCLFHQLQCRRRGSRTYVNETTDIPIGFYEVTIKAFQKRIYPNLGLTDFAEYDGMVPGPTFWIQKGREVLIRFANAYDRPSAIPLHGSYFIAPFGGWAEDTIAPGNYQDYYYPNNQAARTLWYHDHAVHITAINAYFGQAGMYILHDPAEEARLALSAGNYDISLVIQAMQYQSNGKLFPPTNERESLYGDVIHGNGQPWPFLKVEPRNYRFRVLNASISRTFRSTLVQDGQKAAIPFHVIAADAGYLSSPETAANFPSYAGKNITVTNDRDVMADEDYNGTNRVMRFVVGTTVSDSIDNGALPPTLSPVNLPPAKTTVDRGFKFEQSGGEWSINGVAFKDVANLEQLSIFISSISKSSPSYESARLKDVFLLYTNEKVLFRTKYVPWDGVYMFHCHNPVHEDNDMMRALNVTVLKNFDYPEITRSTDPMEARWRDKPYTGTELATVRSATLPFFSSLDAYARVKKIEAAIDAYHSTVVTKRDLPTEALTTLKKLSVQPRHCRQMRRD
ncbi:Cupredoxin [Choiromyces venosus 120613-1]|uniref:Cupredoxin n=1 Tax=Choiromyces venosus 120613-1 TaxID=1336337 RepID=A0A3N4IW69_9PEZI|nr:Cupredoxin [Choiromyces venosus 120613-1]